MGASIRKVSVAVMRVSITGTSAAVLKRGLDVEAFRNSDGGLDHRGLSCSDEEGPRCSSL